MKHKFAQTAWDWLIMLAGAFLYTLSFNLFLDPAQIAPGGVTGIAMIINYLIPALSVGTVSLIFNIPLFFLGLRKVGGAFILRTIVTTVIMSVLLDVTALLPPLTEDPLLASVFGGVLMGVGLGLTFSKNSSTGGSDIVVRVLRAQHPHLSMGKITLLLDIVIITLAAAVFQKVNVALYAIISMYTASISMDAILYGFNFARVAHIITDNPTDVIRRIDEDLDRGATVLDCRGAYQGDPKTMIVCAIKQNQIGTLKQAVHETDPEAFLILFNAYEVLGFGFLSHDRNI